MDKMEQGTTYEEVPLDEQGLPIDEETEANEELEYVPDTIMGIPKDKVIIGAAVLLLAIIAIVVIISRLSSSSNNSDTEDVVIEYDTSMDILIEDYVEDDYYEEPIEDTLVDEEPLTVYDLSTEEQLSLRKAGYSADEINYAIEYGFSVDDLIAASDALYDEAAKEALERMSNTAGAEYKELLNSTYLGQKEQTFVDQRNITDGSSVAYTTTQVINTDYTKCKTNGVQLFLKCKIGEGVYYWYQCTPQRWAALPDAGNIVLQLTFSVYGDCLFVTNCFETDSTLDTIDSSQDLYEVITE